MEVHILLIEQHAEQNCVELAIKLTIIVGTDKVVIYTMGKQDVRDSEQLSVKEPVN